jgi:hypothetical protein
MQSGNLEELNVEFQRTAKTDRARTDAVKDMTVALFSDGSETVGVAREALAKFLQKPEVRALLPQSPELPLVAATAKLIGVLQSSGGRQRDEQVMVNVLLCLEALVPEEYREALMNDLGLTGTMKTAAPLIAAAVVGDGSLLQGAPPENKQKRLALVFETPKSRSDKWNLIDLYDFWHEHLIEGNGLR